MKKIEKKFSALNFSAKARKKERKSPNCQKKLDLSKPKKLVTKTKEYKNI